MIKLLNGYFMDADRSGITLGVPKDTVNKDGKALRTWAKASYYPSVESTLKGYVRRMQVELIASHTGETVTFEQFASELQDWQEQFSDWLSQSFSGLDDQVRQAVADSKEQRITYGAGEEITYEEPVREPRRQRMRDVRTAPLHADT